MANDSSTGGVLAPSPPLPPNDAGLENILQQLVASITGLDPTLVRPRWQPVPPKQPEPTIDWCSVGILSSDEQNFPFYEFDDVALTGTLIAHEDLRCISSFYGPNSLGFAQMLRNGLKVPQNNEQLIQYDMRFIDTGTIRNAPELFNQQWYRRQDLPIRIRRKLSYVYQVKSLLAAEIDLKDDTGKVNATINVPESP